MITVSFACNDPENGLSLDRVFAIEIGDSEFEAPNGGTMGNGSILRTGLKRVAKSSSRCDQAFKISRRVFPCSGWKGWYGNWCWDATRMEEQDVLNLLSYLRRLGWRMTAGLVDLGDLYDSGKNITADVLREAASWP